LTGQTTYAKNELEKIRMENSKPVSTPVNSKLVKLSDDKEGLDPTQFSVTRPDLYCNEQNIQY